MLESLWKKILRRKPLSLLMVPAAGLWLAAHVYRLAFLIYRATRRSPTRLSVPIISVGGITVGGSGKTPTVEVVVKGLQSEGIRVAVISSGYGRWSKEPLLMPGYKLQKLDADVTGDEVRLLAERLPETIFSVDDSKTRAASNLVASKEWDADVIVVDDGFQHFTLACDLNIVVYDASLKEKRLRQFPYGVLREPLRALGRADVIVITRARFARDIARLRARLARISPHAEIYHAGFVMKELVSEEKRLPIKYLEDKSVFLFAGVGHFRPLRKQVAALSGDLDCALELSDHQVYDRSTLKNIKARADEHDSDLIVTTGKDWVKLGDFDFGREIYYLELSIDLDPGEEKLAIQLTDKLDLKRLRV